MWFRTGIGLLKSSSNMSVRFVSAQRKTLEGKVAVVTASTEGIGLAIARRLAQDGAKVVISSRKQPKVDKTVAELTKEGHKVMGLVCHVAEAQHREQLFEKAVKEFGGVDILVSNAGINPAMQSILQVSEKMWNKIIDVNLNAALFLTQKVVPLMEERGGGSIIYISSILGLQPNRFLGSYSVSKTALLALTKVMSQECAGSNIRVNCVAPGFIKTKFSEAISSIEEVNEEIIKTIPMGRFGNPDEVAPVVSFLCSDDAKYITGETYGVTGGMPSRL